MSFSTAPNFENLPSWFKLRAAIGLLLPLSGLIVLVSVFITKLNWMVLGFPFIYYVAVPIADLLLGRDRKNPSPELIETLEGAPYYRALLYIASALYVVSIGLTLWLIGQLYTSGSWGWAIALTLGAALYNGSMILVAHELGHGHNKLDRNIARWLLMMIGYGHFTIEHNAGHHTHVGSDKDPASARFGENFYAFAWRELTGALGSAINLEIRRLKGSSFLSPKNKLLKSWAGSALLCSPFIWLFGLGLIPLICVHHLGCWLMLTKANYVEHYGLGRRQDDQGRLESVRPHHSWNSDYWLTNALAFNLQRHSDHHANASREYQILRTSDQLPQLPAGYPGSFLLALIPPLWFLVMNPKVEAWANEYRGHIHRR